MGDILESKTGSWLVIIYTLTAIGIGAYSFVCTSGMCAPLVVAPIMPWALILQSELGFRVPLMVYPILILLNAAALYVIGVGIEWLWERYGKLLLPR